MKCTRCGAEIPKNYMYCSSCGKEVQLVPDYNFLEDDVLSSIIQEGVKENASRSDLKEKVSKAKSSAKDLTRRKKKGGYIVGAVCLIIAGAALASFLIYTDIQKKHANSYDYQYEQAEEYLSLKDYENALLYYQNALNLRPADNHAQNAMVEIYLTTGKKESAIKLLHEMIVEEPQDKASYEKLISLYAEDEKYDKIRELCEGVRDADILELFTDYLVEQPIFSRISGTYVNQTKITISSSKEYDIYYTLDEEDPAKTGMLYRSPISLEEGTTVITAVTRNRQGIYSEPVKATYTIRYEAPDMPKVTPAGGTYVEPQMITIQVPSDCVAYYTWDGSNPTTSSAVYSGPLEMPMGNQVLSVLLVNSVGLKSSIYRVNYVYMP